MTLPFLVGVAGQMYAGKDTLGDFLVQDHGYTRLAFADKLKEAVVALDPVIDVATAYSSASHWRRLSELRREGETAVELCNRMKVHPEMRRLMRAMGNEVGQGIFGKDFWVDQVLSQVLAGDWQKPYVITDVRYPHEAEGIKKCGGVIVKVIRPGHGNDDDHPSERLVADVVADAEILNDGTVQEYYTQALCVLSALEMA